MPNRLSEDLPHMPNLPPIIFMGTPHFALPSLEGLISAQAPVALVVTQPDRPSGRGKKVTPSPVKLFALEKGIPLFQPNRLRGEGVVEHLKSFQAQCAVVVAYGQILPRKVLDCFPMGVINVHASLLPAYRGAAPIQHALLAGEPMTGVSIMLLDEGMDTGPVLAKEELPIGPRDNAGSLHEKLSILGAELLISTLEKWVAGRMEPWVQDDALATHAPPITKEQLRIPWWESAERIVNRIRAFDPFPGAHALLDQKRVKFFDAALLKWIGEGSPGELVGPSEEGLVILGGDGRALAVGMLQLEGQRRLKAEEFLRGRSMLSGSRFE